jgi:hypothetical protein
MAAIWWGDIAPGKPYFTTISRPVAATSFGHSLRTDQEAEVLTMSRRLQWIIVIAVVVGGP